MGCSTNHRKSESRSIAPAEVRSLPVVQKSGPKPRIDFHCVECGTSRTAYPNYRHKCEPGPVAYQETRKSSCQGCGHNRHGLCMSLRALHPDRPGMISVGIKIPGAKCPEGKWKRTLWVCDDCGSQVFDEKGLDRCPVCRPTKEPRPNFVPLAMSLDEPAEPNHPLAVVSVAVGQNAIDMSKITWPRFRQYAEFVGADFVGVLDDKSPEYRLANKFRIGRICSKYDRTLYLDADIWLRPNVGNLFKIFEAGAVWMHPDTTRMPPGHESWIDSESQRLADDQQITPEKSRCYNSGVVLFDREDCGIWDPPPLSIGNRHVAEQFWVEHRALHFSSVRDLPSEYNSQWYWRDFQDWEKVAKIIHLANCPHGERMSRLSYYSRRESGDFIPSST